MAVVQDDVAAVAVHAEEQGAALLPLEALRAGRGQPGGAVAAGLGVGGGGPAGRVPAVAFDPGRDRVAGWVVAGLAGPPTDLGDELPSLPRVARGEAAPGG